MGSPRECRRFADDLSGFVDQRLQSRRLMQVSEHLIRCPDCSAQVEGLRAVRRRLSSCAASAPPSSSLEQRLQGIAGAECDQPLYWSASPSRRRLHPGVSGTMWTCLAVVGLLVISLGLARPAPIVVDPVRAARDQYAMSLAAIDVNPGVGASMWARQRGMLVGSAVSVDPRRLADGAAAVSIDQRTALDLLAGRNATYSGVQRIWLMDSEGRHRSNDVEINHVSREGATLTVFDAHDEPVLTWFAPNLECCAGAVAGDWEFYRYDSVEVVAGRETQVLEARSEGHVKARWWVDGDSGVAMWTERYATSGEVTKVAGFTSIRFGNAQLATDYVAVEPLSPASMIDTTGWCTGLPECPVELGGLPLVALANSTHAEVPTQHLVYSDGVRALSVTWTRGTLEEGTRVEDTTPGQPLVKVWQTETGVLTVTTGTSRALLAQACAELPAEAPYSYGLWERIGSGLGRLVGVN